MSKHKTTNGFNLSRIQLESLVCFIFVSCAIVSLIQIKQFEPAIAFFILTILSTFHMFSNENAGVYLISSRLTRPESDSGIIHGCLAIPLLLSSKLASAIIHKTEYFEYFRYNLWIALLFGFTVYANSVFNQYKNSKYFFPFFIPFCSFGLLFLNYVFGNEAPPILFSGLAVIVFQIYFYCFFYLFPQSFTIGEASIVTQMLTLLTMDTLAASTFTFKLANLPSFMNKPRNEVYFFLMALILGMILIGIILSPLLISMKQTIEAIGKGKKQKLYIGYPRSVHILSGFFYFGMALFVFFFIWPWLSAVIQQDPILWTWNYATSEPNRLLLTIYWIMLIGFSILLFNLSQVKQRLFSKEKKIPLIFVRKYFHILAVFMFVPAYLHEPRFLQLCFGVAISGMLFVEYIRYYHVPPLGYSIDMFMKNFLDYRDSGPIILSHMYLLLGCALPIWIGSVPSPSFYAGFSGLAVLGIGDTMASLIGMKYGKRRWIETKKTLEGTLAAFVSMIVFVLILYQLAPSSFSLSFQQWSFVVFGLLLASLMEALTKQIDNLTAPLYLFSILTLMTSNEITL